MLLRHHLYVGVLAAKILVLLLSLWEVRITNKQLKSTLVTRTSKGPVAEWLGSALQKLLQRFEPARDLNKRKTQIWPLSGAFLFFMA